MASSNEVVQHGRTAEVVFTDVGKKSLTAESSLAVKAGKQCIILYTTLQTYSVCKIVHMKYAFPRSPLNKYLPCGWMALCHGRGVRIQFVSVIFKIALLCPMGEYSLLASKAESSDDQR